MGFALFRQKKTTFARKNPKQQTCYLGQGCRGLPPKADPFESPFQLQQINRAQINWTIFIWRREWDSNPRYHCWHDGFQDRYLQPLGHLSLIVVIQYLVHPDGFEPPTLCSEDRCSNPLSYGCLYCKQYYNRLGFRYFFEYFFISTFYCFKSSSFYK